MMFCPESPAGNSHDNWDWPVVGATFYLNPTRIDFFLIRLTCCHFGRNSGKGGSCHSVRRGGREWSGGGKPLAEADLRGGQWPPWAGRSG